MKLAIFDFDGTLFQKDTLPFLLSQWRKLEYSKYKYLKAYFSMILLYIKYKTGIKSKLSKEHMRMIAVKRFNNVFKGMTKEEITEFLLKCSKEIKELLNEYVVSEVKKAHLEGYHTVLLSGSYDVLLNNIGEHLKFDTVIGTKLYFSNDLFDFNKELEIVSGELKLQKINELFNDKKIDWQQCRAYADSYSDIHILKSVGYPIAVNPDNKLRNIASKNNWKVII